jgi:hypothetical protein
LKWIEGVRRGREVGKKRGKKDRGIEGRTQAVTDDPWLGTRSSMSVCVTFMSAIEKKPTIHAIHIIDIVTSKIISVGTHRQK